MSILFNCHHSILIKHNFSCVTKFHLWNIIVVMVNEYVARKQYWEMLSNRLLLAPYVC